MIQLACCKQRLCWHLCGTNAKNAGKRPVLHGRSGTWPSCCLPTTAHVISHKCPLLCSWMNVQMAACPPPFVIVGEGQPQFPASLLKVAEFAHRWVGMGGSFVLPVKLALGSVSLSGGGSARPSRCWAASRSVTSLLLVHRPAATHSLLLPRKALSCHPLTPAATGGPLQARSAPPAGGHSGKSSCLVGLGSSLRVCKQFGLDSCCGIASASLPF